MIFGGVYRDIFLYCGAALDEYILEEGSLDHKVSNRVGKVSQ